ncbi:MAG: hypothetical protein C7B46_17025 [Sulfobacillus benefaciens]|uniref:Cell wall hydrolase SleB domain-containing protein n=1 Tax=Sulfobacillus benefaciens TaxID=453960 RepID=A0A2T2X9Q8_9FIRM|nr:MAG: hypothetical protein C7B46_17025 [Sulfobacillus benefaciens]
MRRIRPRFTVLITLLTALLHMVSPAHRAPWMLGRLRPASVSATPVRAKPVGQVVLSLRQFWLRHGKAWAPAVFRSALSAHPTRTPVPRRLPYPLPALPLAVSSAPPVAATHSSRASVSSLHWLAQLIQAEAGNQPFLVRLCVGDVVLNRMQAAGFPHHLRQVILQPGQFSSVSNGTFAQATPTPQTIRAAQNALSGWNPVRGDLYYYNPALPHNPWMNTLTSCQRVGAMVFCP